MSYDLIQVGTGGQGEMWCRKFLQPHVDAGRLNVVAAVDVDPEAHVHAQEGLDLSADECYEGAEAAFEAHPDADCCAIVTPPWVHEDIVDLAVEYDCQIISEKPIADTLEASVRIAEKVDRAGLKMGVTMTHRFDRDKTTLREEIRRDRSGPLDYLVGRFTCNARQYGDWGAFRHDIEDPLLVEGAVHQLDFLADMAGATCETLYADAWTPAWGEYEGDCQALVQLRFENGIRASWEGAKANAVGLNGWGNDYVRAECRDATLVLDDRELYRHAYDPDATLIGGATDERAGEQVPLLDGEHWGNTLLVGQFLDWLDGGEPSGARRSSLRRSVDGGEAMATNVADNLQSVALVEAAKRSSETGEPVQVQAMLREARESVEV